MTPVEDYNLYPDKMPKTACRFPTWANVSINAFAAPEQKMGWYEFHKTYPEFKQRFDTTKIDVFKMSHQIEQIMYYSLLKVYFFENKNNIFK